MRKLTYIIIILSISFTGYIMVYANYTKSLGWWIIGILPFFAWSIFPYLLLWQLNKDEENVKASVVANLVTTIVVSCFGVFVMIEAFFIHLDPQSGIIFIFLPIYQFVPLAVGAAIASRFKKKTAYTEDDSKRTES